MGDRGSEQTQEQEKGKDFPKHDLTFTVRPGRRLVLRHHRQQMHEGKGNLSRGKAPSPAMIM